MQPMSLFIPESFSHEAVNRFELSYRMEKTDNGWKIYDVSVLGAWLVET